MRKSFFLFLLPLCCFLIFSPVSFVEGREVKPVEFNKISENLYEVLGGRGANGGVLICDGEVLIIDAKMDRKSIDQVMSKIRELGGKSVKYLINTHSDGDHVAGNRYYPKSAVIIAHENCRKEFFHPRRDRKPSEWENPELARFIPSVTFQKKVNVFIGSKRVELWHFGVGHTTGDLVVYFPDEKTAFIGDQIFVSRPQLIHSYKGGNSFGHVKNLSEMLSTLDAQKFSSGHSNLVGREEIKKHITQMKERQSKVKLLMEKGKGVEEIKKEFSEAEARLIQVIYDELRK